MSFFALLFTRVIYENLVTIGDSLVTSMLVAMWLILLREVFFVWLRVLLMRGIVFVVTVIVSAATSIIYHSFS